MRTLMLSLGLGVACLASAQQYTITGFEYWFNENDAVTERIWVPATQPGLTVNTTVDIDVSPLPLGVHYLRVRLRDNNNMWSSVLWRMFTKDLDGPNELQLLRYWSQQAAQDPADMMEVPFSTPAQLINIIDNLDFCTYNQTGTTRTFFQLKDSRSQWSSVIARDINIDVVGQAPGVPMVTGPDQVFADSTYTYTATVSGATWYEWTLPPGWTGSSTTGTIVVTAPDQVLSGEISVIAHNACGVGPPGSFTFTVLSVGMDDFDRGTGVSLFPNPTTGLFTLALEGITGRAEAVMFDAQGRQVGSAIRLDGAQHHTLDLSNEANGLYMLRIVSDAGIVTKHVFLQH